MRFWTGVVGCDRHAFSSPAAGTRCSFRLWLMTSPMGEWEDFCAETAIEATKTNRLTIHVLGAQTHMLLTCGRQRSSVLALRMNDQHTRTGMPKRLSAASALWRVSRGHPSAVTLSVDSPETRQPCRPQVHARGRVVQRTKEAAAIMPWS